jgi:hypothetical protein
MSVERSEGEPHDELTGIGAELLELFEAMPASKGRRIVLFIEDDERCATVLGGWDADMDAIAAVFAHLAAVFKANGKTLIIAPLRQG